VLLICISSCKEPECITTSPEINFDSFATTADNKGLLSIAFFDCDGDIGLNDADTLPPYNIEGADYYNLELVYMEKQQGKWIRFDSLTPPFNYRIPVLNKDGQTITLDGTINVTLDPLYYVPIGNFDTIKYEIRLKDRALQVSNIIETPELLKP